ncbi:hypothetical protein [Actinoalloteichus sp. GBA129-24]|nr:hypothetical protein [Actinoalloteichus sp. GBA129-24]APU22446.1 hypothetical protein UA75_22300 [Actinoalloteichus sp. GBA129-24]
MSRSSTVLSLVAALALPLCAVATISLLDRPTEPPPHPHVVRIGESYSSPSAAAESAPEGGSGERPAPPEDDDAGSSDADDAPGSADGDDASGGPDDDDASGGPDEPGPTRLPPPPPVDADDDDDDRPDSDDDDDDD